MMRPPLSIATLLGYSLAGILICSGIAVGWTFWRLAQTQEAARHAELALFSTTVAHQLNRSGGVAEWDKMVSQLVQARASQEFTIQLHIAVPEQDAQKWRLVVAFPDAAALGLPEQEIEAARLLRNHGGVATWRDAKGSAWCSFVAPLRDDHGVVIALVEARSRSSTLGLIDDGVTLGFLVLAVSIAGCAWIGIQRWSRTTLLADSQGPSRGHDSPASGSMASGGTASGSARRRAVESAPLPPAQSVRRSESLPLPESELTAQSLRLKREITDLQVQVSRYQGADRTKSTLLVALCRSLRLAVDSLRGHGAMLVQTRLDRTQRDYVDSLQAGCGDLLTRINDVLDFALLDADCLRLDQRPLRPRQVLEEAVLIVAERCTAQPIELTWYADPVVPERVIGDLSRIRQVLVNLIHLAVSTTEEGAVVVHLTAEADDSLSFRISLTGVTLTAERIRLMLNGAISSDSSSDRLRGEGLGLMLGKRLAQAMGGSLVVEPGEGEDIELVCTLRVTPDEVPHERPLVNRHVVVAHERPAIRRMLASMLERAGATVEIVESSEQLQRMQSDSVVAPAAALVSTRLLVAAEITDISQIISAISTLSSRVSLSLVVDPLHRGHLAQLRAAGSVGLITVPVRHQQLLSVVNDLCTGVKRESGAEAISTTVAQQHPRVLVVEDNEVNQLVLVRMLENFGIQPELAINGREAVERMRAAAAQPYSLVLMDIMMPIMDGLEATREIRKYENRQPSAWIIAVTANSLANDCDKCLDAGMNDYLPKPVTPLALGGAISRWRQATSRQLASQLSASQLSVSQLSVSQQALTSQRAMGNQSANDVHANAGHHDDANFSALEIKAPSISEVDFSGLKTLIRLAGQGAVVEVIDCFLREVVSLRDGIIQAAHDAQGLRAAAHKFKGSSGTVGLRGLSAHTAAIETAAKADDLILAAQLIEALPALCAQGEAELIAFRNEQAAGSA